MESVIDKKRRIFRGQMIRELLVTSFIGILCYSFLYFVEGFPILWTIPIFVLGITFTLWEKWLYTRQAFCPIDIEFEKENIRMTVINMFNERELVISPHKISIDYFAFDTKEKSYILLYIKEKRKRGYLMQNPVWSYEEQTEILKRFSEYKEIPIKTLPVYR